MRGSNPFMVRQANDDRAFRDFVVILIDIEPGLTTPAMLCYNLPTLSANAYLHE